MKISIISVVRNDLPGLMRTIDSLDLQSYKNTQHIIIDGASTDATADYVASISGGETVAISEPDFGIYDAMNKGLRYASGRYIVFMNAGDVFSDPNVLRDVVDELSVRPVDLLYGDSYENLLDHLKIKKPRGHKYVSSGMFACHQSMYYSAKYLTEECIRYNASYKIAGDYEFSARIVCGGASVFYFERPLCIFDMAGQSNSKKGLGRQENWRVQQEIVRLSLMGRVVNRVRYLAVAAISYISPNVYIFMRYVK